MSLRRAVLPGGRPLGLQGDGPWACVDLVPLVGEAFELPCDDPTVRASGRPDRAYLDGARAGWRDHPGHMDFLDPDSPVYDLKQAERDLYLHLWGPWLAARRVLDVGCGVGRFTTAFLDRGADVWGVDGDLESLRRCAWHAVGDRDVPRPGRLDLRWSGVHRLPDVTVDAVVAAEVLPYVPEQEAALAAMVARLEPGGVLLFSLEARWGWAASPDAPAGGLDALLAGGGIVDLPGDRWVRTHERSDVEALVGAAGLELALLEPSHWITDGPLEDLAGEVGLKELLAAEAALRDHPVWGPLHRLWIGAAIKPV